MPDKSVNELSMKLPIKIAQETSEYPKKLLWKFTRRISIAISEEIPK